MKTTNKELEAIAKQVLLVSKKGGAKQASASVSRSRFFKVGTRGGTVENLEESSDRGLGVRLFVDGRYAEASTSDLRPEAVDDFVLRTLEASRLLDADLDRALPEQDLLKDPPTMDLDNFDPAIDQIPKERKMEMATQADEAARGVDSVIFHAEGEFNESRGERVLITSDGFEGYQNSTSFYVVAQAYVRDTEHKRRSQWAYRQGVMLSALDNPASIGVEAAQRALNSLGAGPIPTGTYDLVLENRIAGWLLGLIMEPLSGRALHLKRSFLEGKQDEQVASPLLTLIDNPLIKRGLGSRLFDGEGIPARVRPIIEAGVLKNYYLDTYYARKLGRKPTSGGTSNLVLSPGENSAEEIIKGVDKGIWVTQFLGGNSNSLTGDFSTGVGGFLIENGQLGRPVAEVNIGGKIQDILMALAEVGNDPFPYSSSQVPTLKLPNISVSGT